MSRQLSVRAHALGFSYDSSTTPLFSDATFHLTSGWTGLVGANGAGKTTLLKLMRGALTPTEGQLQLEPRGARVVWCAQGVEARDELEAFAAASDRQAHRLRAMLELDDAVFERWNSGASPGERRRWQVAAALWAEPEVLLLDEPGNHLDAEGRAILLDALKTFRGVGVLVSHDRGLLDALTTSTLRVHGGTVRQFAAPWSQARELWTLEAEQTRERQGALKDKLERDLGRLQSKRETLRDSTRQRSTGARMKNKSDGDARTLGADFRAEQAEMAHAAQLRRVEKKVGDVKAALADVRVDDDAGQALFLRYEPCPRPTVAQHEKLHLARGEHVWVRGRNGAGKTTLINELLKASTLPPERVLVLPQELTSDDAREDLETLSELPRDVKGRVLQLVHALGVEPDVLLHTESPSPGEARKLRLALGLGRHVWLAVLDEPTNHLDLPAIERLEAALAVFPGAILLVTHDESLGAKVTTRQVELTR